ncbi:MAG: acyl-CoA-binding protein [Lautropia sp.]|nr:acyl-CoA-binding protein [Lautropia sp.]
MSSLEDNFRKAQQEVRDLPTPLDRIQQLRLYALFMQATVGDVSGRRPGFSDLEGRSRWDAWLAVAGIGREEAMREYIAEVARLRSRRGVGSLGTASYSLG